MKKVLNVGGNNKEIPIPRYYQGWEHLLLDIDPKGNPDIVCDSRELVSTPAEAYDSIYCSHNLEHYYIHDVHKVLAGFSHILKPDGFVHLRVPDIGEVMKEIVTRKIDINDVLYVSSGGAAITGHDVIYGWGLEIERSGCDFYAHKTGFTKKLLLAVLKQAGFEGIFVDAVTNSLELNAFAFKHKPTDEYFKLLELHKPQAYRKSFF
jgi:SAM-dependent methyltransferase